MTDYVDLDDAHRDLLALCGGDASLALRHALGYLADLTEGGDQDYLADLLDCTREVEQPA